MNNKPTITIWRKGKFSVPGLVDKNKCGTLGQTEFNYSVEITVDALDAKGFVCDNFNVPKAFERKFGQGVWEASCEQLAGGGIYMMKSLCDGRALKITSEVSPIAEAGVRVEWTLGQDLPTFFPKRLDKPKAHKATERQIGVGRRKLQGVGADGQVVL